MTTAGISTTKYEALKRNISEYFPYLFVRGDIDRSHCLKEKAVLLLEWQTEEDCMKALYIRKGDTEGRDQRLFNSQGRSHEGNQFSACTPLSWGLMGSVM